MLDGDLVFVPDFAIERLPIREGEVTLQGHTARPGNYPLTPGMTVRQLLERSGELLGETYTARGEIFRFASHDTRHVLPFDVAKALAGDPEHDLLLQEWDIVRVYAVLDVIPEPWVEVQGAVHGPGRFRFVEGMKVRDLIFRAREIRDDAYLFKAELYRLRTDRTREVIPIDLTALLEGDESQNILLRPEDHLVVFSVGQAVRIPEVSVVGEVREPGTFELSRDMRLSDLLYRAGGLTPRADLGRIEIYRPNYPAGPVEVLQLALPELEDASLSASIVLDLERDPLLVEGDHVFIRARREHASERSVVLAGEVRYPGTYRLRPGERLASVVERAGGFTEQAYLYGAVFTRRSVREFQQRFIADFVRAEREVIQRERTRIESLPLTSDERERRWRALEHRADLLDLIESRAPQGRVILELDGPDLAQTPANLLLQDGDRFVVPPYPETVLVVGSVYMPEAVVYRPGQALEYYLRQVGGPRPEANTAGIYVIKANGRVETAFTGFSTIHQGDTIVVPSKLDPLFLDAESASIAAPDKEVGH